MRPRIVTGAERAQEQARRATRTMRRRVFAGEEQPRTVPERAARVVTAVMAAREEPRWWARLLGWVANHARAWFGRVRGRR